MLYVIDLDCTLIDTKDLVISGGPEPEPGTAEHEAWVNHVTSPEILAAAKPVPSVMSLVKSLLYDDSQKVVFLTNRRQRMLRLTQDWLYKHINPGIYDYQLIMRPDDCLTRAGAFKAQEIEKLIYKGEEVLIVDDDQDGSLEVECKKHNWTLLKVMCY